MSLLRVLIFALLLIISTGCSTILDKDREFTEPMTGSIMVVRDMLAKDKTNVDCESKAKPARVACEKELEELKKSFERAKN